VLGVVVHLPLRTAPLCLPVLFRLWRGKGTASAVELAGDMLAVLAAALPGCAINGVGDAAYHGRALLVEGTTWTTRLPTNAVLYALAPPCTGKRGRPARKGARLGEGGDPVCWAHLVCAACGAMKSEGCASGLAAPWSR
jgi:hypothetical protein